MNLSGDIQSKKLIIAKGLLFVFLGVISSILVVIENGAWWRSALLLTVCVWAFCRAYYFAFYVITHYVDGNFKYAGLWSAVRYLMKRR